MTHTYKLYLRDFMRKSYELEKHIDENIRKFSHNLCIKQPFYKQIGVLIAPWFAWVRTRIFFMCTQL